MAVLVKEQLEQTKKWKLEYGEKTLVLTQVGSFFESYALKNHLTNKIYGSNIEEFAALNEMVVAQKNGSVGEDAIMMAGVGVPYIEPYLKKLLEHDYTVVLYRQDVNAKNTTRSLAEIISPGTYFAHEQVEELSNNVMCIWLLKNIVGIANVDIFTGKTDMHQFTLQQQHMEHDYSTYDQLERYVTTYKPNECILISSSMSEMHLKEVCSFVGLENTKVHFIVTTASTASTALASATASTALAKAAYNAEKQLYQQETLRRFYPHYTFDVQNSEYYLATQAFCFLLNFVAQHNPQLVSKLTWPETKNYTDNVLLANHSLAQLNITDDVRQKGKMRSVSAWLNNCVTKMGQRQFTFLLQNPTSNIPKLEASYEITAHVLQTASASRWRQQLQSLQQDLEKFVRRVILQKITPHDIALLIADLKVVALLFEELNDEKILKYIFAASNASNAGTASNASNAGTASNASNASNASTIGKICLDICRETEHLFKIDKMLGLKNIDGTTECFVQPQISFKIDQLMRASLDGREKLETVRKYLATMVDAKKDTGIKIHETAKTPALLLGTSHRMQFVKQEIAKLNSKNLTTSSLSYLSKYTLKAELLEFDLKNITFEEHGSNKKEMSVTSPQIKEIVYDNQASRNELVMQLQETFQKYVQDFQTQTPHLKKIIEFVTALDVLQCKCYLAQKYNYCRPTIAYTAAESAHTAAESAPTASTIAFTQIRHPLIEHLQTNEAYVTNDLTLNAASGILLYGTNAVGKTSFIKAIGIAVIMAQAGLYVPCSSFTFRPYTAIFTRILGNDNLFKGLSTFAVEMSELRTILTQCDGNSLVLGDELCSGTESSSALSIFMAGIEELYQKQSTFLFATHFHEIVHYDELQTMLAHDRVKLLHMAVCYDQERKRLIYDRKLKTGAGENMYGLEVCKALHLPVKFLERAHTIRVKYDAKAKHLNPLALPTTHYNAKKVKNSLCELCKNHVATEVHHLQHQQEAQKDNGYIVSAAIMHKNHPANLLSICNECHLKMHAQSAQHKISKTLDGDYILTRI